MTLTIDLEMKVKDTKGVSPSKQYNFVLAFTDIRVKVLKWDRKLVKETYRFFLPNLTQERKITVTCLRHYLLLHTCELQRRDVEM